MESVEVTKSSLKTVATAAFDPIKAAFVRVFDVLEEIRKRLITAFFAVSTLIVFSVWYFSGVDVPEGGALNIRLEGVVVEAEAAADPLQSAVFGGGAQRVIVADVVRVLEAAAIDERLAGVVLDLTRASGVSVAEARTIGAAIREFQQSGRPVLAVSDRFSQGTYMLASYADEIWAAPGTQVEIIGIAFSSLFYKPFFDRYGLTPVSFQVGDYKGANESYVREGYSPQFRAQLERITSGLWSEIVEVVLNNRAVDLNEWLGSGQSSRTQAYTDSALVPATAAQDFGLVDRVATSLEIRRQFADRFGWDSKKGTYRFVSWKGYLTDLPEAASSGGDVAIVSISGPIIDERSPRGVASGETVSNMIAEAATDPDVKGIVIRVDTPGGSVLASDLIRMEMIAAREKKPVVVSMGEFAASGGYWVATAADYVIADPSTVTGSIGVVATMMRFEGALERLGIESDSVATHEISTMYAPSTVLEERAHQYLDASIERIYNRFVTLVANSRNLSSETVDEVAQGRLWLGRDAFDRGLVDQLGDLQDAVAYVEDRVGVDGLRIRRMENVRVADLLLGALFSASTTAGSQDIVDLRSRVSASLVNRTGAAPLIDPEVLALWRMHGADKVQFLALCGVCDSL